MLDHDTVPKDMENFTLLIGTKKIENSRSRVEVIFCKSQNILYLFTAFTLAIV